VFAKELIVLRYVLHSLHKYSYKITTLFSALWDADLTVVVVKLNSQHLFTVYINASQVVFTIQDLRVTCFIIFTMRFIRQLVSFWSSTICSVCPSACLWNFQSKVFRYFMSYFLRIVSNSSLINNPTTFIYVAIKISLYRIRVNSGNLLYFIKVIINLLPTCHTKKIPSSFISHPLAYEDGADTVFRNVGY
jgi:hypothetical protein